MREFIITITIKALRWLFRPKWSESRKKFKLKWGFHCIVCYISCFCLERMSFPFLSHFLSCFSFGNFYRNFNWLPKQVGNRVLQFGESDREREARNSLAQNPKKNHNIILLYRLTYTYLPFKVQVWLISKCRQN